MEKKENNINKFDIEAMFKETYEAIATWHNTEPNAKSLKHLSFSIIQNIITKSFENFDIQVNFDTDIDEDTRQKVNSLKQFKD